VAANARLRQVTAPLPTPLTRSSESPGPSPSVAPRARYRWIPFRCSPRAGPARLLELIEQQYQAIPLELEPSLWSLAVVHVADAFRAVEKATLE